MMPKLADKRPFHEQGKMATQLHWLNRVQRVSDLVRQSQLRALPKGRMK